MQTVRFGIAHAIKEIVFHTLKIKRKITENKHKRKTNKQTKTKESVKRQTSELNAYIHENYTLVLFQHSFLQRSLVNV